MGNVSKLVIKACRDKNFSSFTGEFITSINPENLSIQSEIAYHLPRRMAGSNLLQYCGSPPKLLSFSLLFDNTGIVPGSNTLKVMEQVQQLQDIAYDINKKHNAPNYIRIIWGQIDFKGRLVKLDIVYTKFQMDGTLMRAEARIAVLEEVVSALGRGKTAAGVDSNYAQASGAAARSKRSTSQAHSHANDTFKETPGGMNGAYSSAPEGAYDGKPDDPYLGPTAPSGGLGSATLSKQDHKSTGSMAEHTAGGSSVDKADGIAGIGTHGMHNAAAARQSNRKKKSKSRQRPGKLNSIRGSGITKGACSAVLSGVGGGLAAGLAAVSPLNWLIRLQKLVKKVAPKAYNAAKSIGKKI